MRNCFRTGMNGTIQAHQDGSRADLICTLMDKVGHGLDGPYHQGGLAKVAVVSFKARTLIFKNETIQAKMDISKSNLPPSVFTLNYYLSLIANLILSFVLDEELQTSRKKKRDFPLTHGMDISNRQTRKDLSNFNKKATQLTRLPFISWSSLKINLLISSCQINQGKYYLASGKNVFICEGKTKLEWKC